MALAGYMVDGAGIHTETQINAQGTGIHDVHVVPYTITTGPAQGVRRVVKVPAAQYTPGNVQAQIEADVDNTHRVASLGQQQPTR